MLCLDIRMGGDAVMDVVQKTRGRKQGAAALAALLGMAADDVVADRYGADIVPVFHPDDLGRADVHAGAAADAATF